METKNAGGGDEDPCPSASSWNACYSRQQREGWGREEGGKRGNAAGLVGTISGSGRGLKQCFPLGDFPGGSDDKSAYLQCRIPEFNPSVRKVP